VSVGPEHEAPRPAGGDGFSDAVTFAFGDERADLYGVARLGLAGGAASGLVILFHDGDPVVVSAEGGIEVTGSPGWDDVSAAGLDTEIVEPLQAWRLRYAGDEASLDLDVRALGAVAELDPAHPAAKAGGMTGYEQLCRVTGTAIFGGRTISVDGRGQRGHSWGAPDWERIEVARTVSAWLDDDVAVTVTAIRPAGKADHGREAIAATILEPAGEDDEPSAVAVADTRLSTTYDAAGRQRQAGLELWVDEDGLPRRAAGELLCGTSLDLGRLRLDCAFFRWRMDGHSGFGRYDILRRA
jgi:hypothetical protein